MVFQKSFLASIITVFGSVASADLDFTFSYADYTYTAGSGTTFTITDHFVWSWATATNILDPECEVCDNDPDHILSDVAADVDSTSAEACAAAGCKFNNGENPFTSSCSYSDFESLSSIEISWTGFWTAQGSEGHCDYALCTASGGYGSYVSFTSDGDFTITPPPPPTSGSGDAGRRVDANLICLPFGPVSSWVVGFGGTTSSSTSTATIMLGAGSYDIRHLGIVIDDTVHDVTGDARFNQDDIDYLVSNVLGTMLASDPLYTDRFDFQGDGSVDTDDIDILQCFVDACLDARRIGDADCDNDVDCDDLLIAGAHPFAGEDFTGTTYLVGFDADLDGDNDAADKEAIRDRMLEVEPANFTLDNTIDFFDNSEFLTLYGANDPRADLTGDGMFDFFDLSAFVAAYSSPNCLVP